MTTTSVVRFIAIIFQKFFYIIKRYIFGVIFHRFKQFLFLAHDFSFLVCIITHYCLNHYYIGVYRFPQLIDTPTSIMLQ